MTIEDAAELRLRQPHVVRLESRPASVEGTRRGDDPRPAPERAADAPRPDRDRRGARRRGARPADRAEHRPRRRALDRPRQLARGRAAPARDAGADGRRRAAARRRFATSSRAASTWSSTSSADGPLGWSAPSPRCEGLAGAVGVRELWRRERPVSASRAVLPVAAAAAAAASLAAGRARGGRCASPGARRAGWPRRVEPLRRAGREGYAPDRAPSAAGSRRSGPRRAAASAARCSLGPAPRRAARRRRARPRAGMGVGRAARRYRRAVERGARRGRDRDRRRARGGPLAARRARAAAGVSLEGPPARRAGAGRRRARARRARPPTRSRAWRPRLRSPRVDAFARRSLSQRLAGGDLVGPAAALRGRRRRARPVVAEAPLGDRPGALHRPAGGRDAGAARRCSPSCSPGLPRRGARQPGSLLLHRRRGRRSSSPASPRSGASAG